MKRVHHYYHQSHHGPFVPMPAGHGVVGSLFALMILCTVVWPLQLVWLMCFVLPFKAVKWIYGQIVLHQMINAGLVVPREES